MRLLTWYGIHEPEVASDIETLRRDSLQLLFWVTLVAHLAWYLVGSYTAPIMDYPRYLALAAVTLSGMWVTYRLMHRDSALAAVSYVLVLTVSLSLSAWLLRSEWPLVLSPFAILATVVLLRPLAGGLVALLLLGTFGTLTYVGELPATDFQRINEVTVASLVAVGLGWVLTRATATAVQWAARSYAQAVANTDEARKHRAEAVQAAKQLDIAYYRLERANAALEVAWRAAEAAERSKSEFVTNISHELRTPLNLIVGFSELIVTSPESYGENLPAVYRGDINAIYRSAQHLLTLTDDVIDLARLGMGRLALAREPVHFEQVVKDACSIVREYIEAKGLWLSVEVKHDLPVVHVDRLRIRQVLLNLLTNAARFTDTGGISVSVQSDGEQLLVEVSDTGRGIAPEDRSRVFEQFYRVNGDGQSTPDRMGGAGLGLSLSKRLIELHEGEMGFESQVGVGTTFWFKLPLAMASQTPLLSSRSPRSAAGGRSVSARERLLVLVSDDRGLAEFLQRHLRGFRAVTAADRSSAVSLATDLRATAILADASEPVAKNYADSPVPIISLPLPSRQRIEACLGVTAFLTKPVTRADLRAAITALNRQIRTVLVVDDDPRFARLIGRYLRTSVLGPDCQILAVHNGREALAAMATAMPDLVLLDIVMPEMSGSELLEAMKADSRLSDLPVIVISAQAESSEGLSLKEPLSLIKPEGFQLEELLGMVEALLGAVNPPQRYLTEPTAALSPDTHQQ